MAEYTGNQLVSSLWQVYIKINDATAQCNRCNRTIKTPGGCTTGLHGHLESRHKLQAPKRKRAGACSAENVDGTKKLDSFVLEKNSMDAILARFIACAGIPISVFRTSDVMRECVHARLREVGITATLPLSDGTIKAHVFSYHERATHTMKRELEMLKRKGHWFCVDFDEWTGRNSNRFINVTIYTNLQYVWNLGLVHITGQATSERILQLVQERLTDYGVEMERDIVCFTTDGAAAMKKIGRLWTGEQQLCIAHGIQLAVLDVLYEKPRRGKLREEYCEESEDGENEVACMSDDDEVEMNSDDDDDDDEEGHDQGLDIEDAAVENEIANHQVKSSIAYVRRISRLFKSGHNNEILQQYVKVETGGSSLHLITDCRTRWCSLFDMLERYWKIKACVEKALVDLRSKLRVSPAQNYILACILKALDPVNATVKLLCQRDATLIDATTALKLLIAALDCQSANNPVAKRLVFCLKKRIHERWTLNAKVLMYLKYGLHAPEPTLYECEQKYVTDDNDDDVNDIFGDWIGDDDDELLTMDVFVLPKKKMLTDHIVKLLRRLHESCRSNQIEEVEELEEIEPAKRYKSYAELLHSALNDANEAKSSSATTISTCFAKVVSQEMTNYEKTGVKGMYLRACYDMLISIKPTSVESERAFSTGGYFCSKIRSRLSPVTLDKLCFLRHFMKNDYFKG